MKIIKKELFNIVKAEEGKQLRDKIIDEHEEIYYFEEAIIPKNLTLEECQEMYVEEKI